MNMIRLPSLRRKKKERDLTPDRKYFRITVWAFLGLTVILTLAALTSFLLTLRGPDQTQVPDTVNEELVDALLSLQERGLYPQVQLRYHSDPLLQGHVISQDPEAGAVVRAGRRITLIVSQGAVIEEIADYRGRTLQEVQAEIQAIGAGGEDLLRIQGVSYVFDDTPVGTIIEQTPPPGTDIAGRTQVSLVVSRGSDVERVSLPTFLGLDWRDAVQVLSRENIPFIFAMEDQPTIGQNGVVVAQDPEPGTQVVTDTPVELTIRAVRELDEDERFGIFDRTLPEYAVSVELAVVIIGPEGESSTMFEMVHPGGRLAFPYRLPVGSTIVVYRYDTEVIRFVIRDETPGE